MGQIIGFFLDRDVEVIPSVLSQRPGSAAAFWELAEDLRSNHAAINEIRTAVLTAAGMMIRSRANYWQFKMLFNLLFPDEFASIVSPRMMFELVRLKTCKNLLRTHILFDLFLDKKFIEKLMGSWDANTLFELHAELRKLFSASSKNRDMAAVLEQAFKDVIVIGNFIESDTGKKAWMGVNVSFKIFVVFCAKILRFENFRKFILQLEDHQLVDRFLIMFRDSKNISSLMKTNFSADDFNSGKSDKLRLVVDSLLEIFKSLEFQSFMQFFRPVMFDYDVMNCVDEYLVQPYLVSGILSSVPEIFIVLWNWELSARGGNHGFYQSVIEQQCLIELTRWFKYQLMNRISMVETVEKRIKCDPKFSSFAERIRGHLFGIIESYQSALLRSKPWMIHSERLEAEFELQLSLTHNFFNLETRERERFSQVFSGDVLFLFLKYHFVDNIPSSQNQALVSSDNSTIFATGSSPQVTIFQILSRYFSETYVESSFLRMEKVWRLVFETPQFWIFFFAQDNNACIDSLYFLFHNDRASGFEACQEFQTTLEKLWIKDHVKRFPQILRLVFPDSLIVREFAKDIGNSNHDALSQLYSFILNLTDTQFLQFFKKCLRSMQENSSKINGWVFVVKDICDVIPKSVIPIVNSNSMISKYIVAYALIQSLQVTSRDSQLHQDGHQPDNSVKLQRSKVISEMAVKLSEECGKICLISKSRAMKHIVYRYLCDILFFKSKYFDSTSAPQIDPKNELRLREFGQSVQASAISLASIIINSRFIREIIQCPVFWSLFSEKGPIFQISAHSPRNKNEPAIYKTFFIVQTVVRNETVKELLQWFRKLQFSSHLVRMISELVSFARSPEHAEFVKIFESRLLSLQVNSKMWETISNQKFWDILLDQETMQALENGQYMKFVVQSIVKSYPIKNRLKNVISKIRNSTGSQTKSKPENLPSEAPVDSDRAQTVVLFFSFLTKILDPLFGRISSRF